VSTFDIAEVVRLLDEGFTPDEIRAYGGSAPIVQAPVKAAKAPKAKKATNAFYANVIASRVPCAYGSASCGFFAPNGVGSQQHTGCKKGRAALAAARR
jgi:hypothetical protein